VSGLSEIKSWFNKYGVIYFEHLNIWDIQELKEIFIKKTKRNPVVKKYPGLLIKINNLKNMIRNRI
jgi:hypothetical protein